MGALWCVCSESQSTSVYLQSHEEDESCFQVRWASRGKVGLCSQPLNALLFKWRCAWTYVQCEYEPQRTDFNNRRAQDGKNTTVFPFIVLFILGKSVKLKNIWIKSRPGFISKPNTYPKFNNMYSCLVEENKMENCKRQTIKHKKGRQCVSNKENKKAHLRWLSGLNIALISSRK